MTTRNIVLAIAALLVLGGAVYFAMQERAPEEPLNQGTETATDNTNAACEGALAYMSFPDGAAADAFVAECKAGGYPEVIERYETQMNADASL